MSELTAIVVAILSGCSVERPSNPPADPPLGTEEVESAALAAWSDALGSVADPPPILWFEGECLDYSDSTPTFCEDGRTQFVPGDVEIHLAARPVASQTALAHELLHWSLHETGHGWDGDHSSAEWGLLDPLNAELAAAGW